jgi:N-acyl-D-amino-acid deacylase
VDVLAQEGAGVFQLVEDPPSLQERPAREARLIDLAVRSQVPIAIGATSGGRSLELLDAAAAAGSRMFGLTHPRGIGSLSSFRSRLPFDSLPEWAPVRALPLEQQRQALADPSVRERLVRSAQEGPYGRAIGAEARRPDFHRMRILDSPLPPNPTVADAARARGIDPVELMIELALETDLKQFFVQTFAPFDDAAVKAAMKHPRTVPTFSDAGAHVSQISDCSIHTHLLGHWVRDRGDFTIEEAVRMLTLAPARAWGLHDRGLLLEGMVADLNVFDADRVAPSMPELVHDLPAGEPRISQRAVGFRATIVAGQIVHREGSHTGALPGRLLRGAAATRGTRQR